jgi:hypothetical protein
VHRRFATLEGLLVHQHAVAFKAAMIFGVYVALQVAIRIFVGLPSVLYIFWHRGIGLHMVRVSFFVETLACKTAILLVVNRLG